MLKRSVTISIALFVVFSICISISNPFSKKEITQEQRADIDSILLAKADQNLMTEAVHALLRRADVARVHIKIGELDYPRFDLTLGKNEKPLEIGNSVSTNEDGIRIFIGYFQKSVRKTDILDEIIQPHWGLPFFAFLYLIVYALSLKSSNNTNA